MRVRSVHTGIECALVCWCALQLAHWQRVVRAGIGLRVGVLGVGMWGMYQLALADGRGLACWCRREGVRVHIIKGVWAAGTVLAW